SDGDCHTPLPCEVRKGNDTTSRARSLAVRGGQDAGCRILVGFNYNLPPPALGERRHRGLARRLVAVHRSARYAAGGGGGGFGGLGGGGLGGRGGKMATRKVKCIPALSTVLWDGGGGGDKGGLLVIRLIGRGPNLGGSGMVAGVVGSWEGSAGW